MTMDLQRSGCPKRQWTGCKISQFDIWLLAFGAVIQAVLAQEKWVWGSRDNKQGFARDDGKGRYGVYEPEAPDEPYRPGVRPPPANLPPLIRPSGRPPTSHISNLDNNRPLTFPNSNNNYNSGINNNRPSLPDNYNNRRPTGGQLVPSYPGRPPVAARPPPASPPPLPPFPPKTPQHHPENKDPTNFEKCKCAYSFNCKSPAILFGTCDSGKKYCCEKFSASRPRGPIDNDQGDPLVLVGPGGPFDPVFKDQILWFHQFSSDLSGLYKN
ncbi:uncharacterized protein isoform X3 [Rhodnius prolixus]|uniref:uncharacterized protein isoform X3 n=1 Tax=Rhodnius prolixus TaxID=13249 RepID=UPI003D18EC32